MLPQKKGGKKMKIIKLVQNETIKTFKKTSTKILVILSILSLLVAVGLAKLVMAISDIPGYYMENSENWKEQMKEQISSMKKTIETEGAHYDRESLANLKAEVETYELALKNDVNYIYIYDNSNWKTQLLSQIQTAKYNVIMSESMQDSKAKEENEKIVKERVNILEKNDFAGYIEFEKENKKKELEDKKITKEEYDDEIYLLELQKKYDIFKESIGVLDWKADLYRDIKEMKTNLRTGINSTSR